MSHQTPRDKFIKLLKKLWHLYQKVVPPPDTRRIFVNEPLPQDMINPKTGHPLYHYVQNKVRTTKYTAWNFMPKDLALQFLNIANCYFLFIIILGAFQIFGVQSPGMQAVPLVVIVCLTAMKDAVEDFRRAKSDHVMNTARVHLLVGMHNPNVFIKKPNAYQRFSIWWTNKFWDAGSTMASSLSRSKRKRKREKKKLRNEKYQLEKKRKQLLREASPAGETVPVASPAVATPPPVSAPSDSTPSVATPEVAAYPAVPAAVLTPPPPNESARTSIDTYRTANSNGSQVSGIGELASVNPTKSYATVKMTGRVSPFVKDTVTNPHITPLGTYNFRNTYWKYINVGDIIRVRSGEEVPADCVLLSSSDEKGLAFVETKNLDGETNLKPKDSLNCGKGLRHAGDFERVAFSLETEPPCKELYKFRGVLKYHGYEGLEDTVGTDESESVSYKNVLLRGCILKNVDWALCIVFATGHETKIMLNSGKTPSKRSKLAKGLNVYVIINFCLLFVMCFVAGLVNGLYYHKKHTSRVYFEYKPYAGWSAAANGAVDFFVNLILYQTLVPISLYITIEIIKCMQAFFIYSDVKMYYDRLDFPCTPKSWSISDDLGQIEYIFSDKTGTLTQNVMQFKKCTVNGKQYGLTYTDAQQGSDKRYGVDVAAKLERMTKEIDQDRTKMLDELKEHPNDQFEPDELTFISSEYVKDLYSSDDTRRKSNIEFMAALALCHTVMTSTDDDGHIEYKAESPDEAALVSVARDMGIVFTDKAREGQVVSSFGGDPKLYRVLQIIPFNSTRKRMSIVLKRPDGRIVLYCKGADNVIYERLSAKDNDREMASKTAIHLGEFAEEGLRTLCIAKREVPQVEFDEWHDRYKEATKSLDSDRELQMERVGEEIENELVLLGGTAIEDRLQTGVPSSIALTREAGIKLWVLTGDKVETAISIGFSCNLLTTDMELLVIKGNGEEEDESEGHTESCNLVKQYLKEKFDMDGTDEELQAAKLDHSTPTSNDAVIIDGSSLREVMIDPKTQIRFLLLCKQCSSVLCCRVSPAQKAEIVKMVKDNLDVMTLAIGDGANDVSMIQTANIGVGIAGEEGRQAVMSSDYAIGQFRYLIRLLLVHGRWSYRRLAEMIPCFFYKNVVYVMPLFWYGIFVDFDGTYLYEYTYLMLFNLFFTSMPVIMMGCLDQDVTAAVSMAVPQLYRVGILSKLCTVKRFAWYMFDGMVQSVICFFTPWLLHHNGVFARDDGLMLDHRFWFGVYCAHIAIFACNTYVLFRQYRWDWLTLLLWFLSVIFIFVWTGLWTISPSNSEAFFKAAPECYGSASFWASLFVGYLFCMVPRLVYDVGKQKLAPEDVDVIREQVRQGKYKHIPEDYDPTSPEFAEMAARRGSLDEEAAIDAANEKSKGGKLKFWKHKSKKTAVADRSNAGRTALQRIKTEMELEGQSSHRSSLEGLRTTKDIGVTSATGLMKVFTRKSTDSTEKAAEVQPAVKPDSEPTLEKPAPSAMIGETTQQSGHDLGLASANVLMNSYSTKPEDPWQESAEDLAGEDAGIQIQDNASFVGDDNDDMATAEKVVSIPSDLGSGHDAIDNARGDEDPHAEEEKIENLPEDFKEDVQRQLAEQHQENQETLEEKFEQAQRKVKDTKQQAERAKRKLSKH